ncbi:MAG: hypothetical protein ACYCWE_03905 [Eubacteriales bacterium]
MYNFGQLKSHRPNIAFKCNFCDGGKSDTQVGFNGVCSDEVIIDNIRFKKRYWCSCNESSCRQYLNGDICRRELDEIRLEDQFVCYESQLLHDWRAYAGIVQTGRYKGTPMKLNQVKENSLCVLTTRMPGDYSEDYRLIFAAFLIGEFYEGGITEEAYVTAASKYKIILSPEESKKMLFWNYHVNINQPDKASWSSGLHRYLDNNEAAMILRDIASVKRGTCEEALASDFYDYYCKINNIKVEDIGQPNGVLKQFRVN